jgi:hypothetical protein
MLDVALYGHLTVDKIYTGFDYTESLGSMANVWQALRTCQPLPDVKLIPTDIGEAIIYQDKLSSKRYSKAILSQHVQAPHIEPAQISVVGYLNELADASWISQLPGLVIADVCTGKPLDHQLLELVDMLFVGDSEVGNVVDLDQVPDSCQVVLHSPVYSTDGYEFHLSEDMYLTNCAVLGAGDMFLANYIQTILQAVPAEDRVKTAHLATTTVLGAKV